MNNQKYTNRNVDRRYFLRNLGLGSVGLYLAACTNKNFLDVAPKTVLDSQSFYRTVDNLIIGLNGVYGSLRKLYADSATFVAQEVVSDNVEMPAQEQPERTNLDYFRADATDPSVASVWEDSYKLIDLANIVIKNAPDVSGDSVLAERVSAEAKFLRCLVYFELVKYWGRVPLRLNPTSDFEHPGIPSAEVADIYNHLVTELKDISNVLPVDYSGNKNNEVGRITRYAAQTLLGKVLLQQGSKNEAKTVLQGLYNKFSLIDYSDIYKPGNSNSAESIFEIGFNPDNNTGMTFNNTYIPRAEAVRLGIVAGGSANIHYLTFSPTKDLVDAFESGDIRKNATIGIDAEVDRPYISKFIDLNATGKGSNINFVVFRYADVLLSLAEATGESTEAYGYINEVRDRANLGSIDASTPGTFSSKIMHERRVELAFERHRWSDLLRLPASEAIAIMEAQLSQQTGSSVSIPTYRLLYPIPEFERTLSENLVDQNDGYE